MSASLRCAGVLALATLTACATGSSETVAPAFDAAAPDTTPTADSSVADGAGDSIATDTGTAMDTGATTDSATEAEAPPPAPTCTDMIKNGAETDVDCGGAACPKCALGKVCAGATDCDTGLCVAGRCAAPSCTDGLKNGTESDVDCGGSCPKCSTAKICGAPIDCESGVCSMLRCAAPSCIDAAKNGSESDVDCGGSACPKCVDGKGCAASSDCVSGYCSGMKCVVPSCTDMVKNGSESDVDCGGSCAKCASGKGCASGADCASGSCVSGVCAASCTDGVKNGKESDVDCGGDTCAACGIGKTCAAQSDCSASVCVGGKCVFGATCKELHTLRPELPSGAYTIGPASAAFAAYCDMGTAGGGWTLVLKANGGSTTFSFESAAWTDSLLVNGSSTDLSTTEAKLQAYLSVAFGEIGLAFVDGGTTRTLVLPIGGSSMLGRMSSSYASTSLGRDAWKGLMSLASLQPNCNREGINVRGDPPNDTGNWTRVRIGIIANQEGDCGSPDSFIGVGGYSNVCGANPGISAGNVAVCSGDAGDRATPAFAYVFVR